MDAGRLIRRGTFRAAEILHVRKGPKDSRPQMDAEGRRWEVKTGRRVGENIINRRPSG